MKLYKNTEWQKVDFNNQKKNLPINWGKTPIGEIIIANDKSTIKASESKKFGKYPFFNCSEVQTKNFDNYLIDGENIFITTGGDYMFNLYFYGKAAYSTDVWAVKIKEQNPKFINYFLKSNFYINQSYFRGFKFKHLDKKGFKQMIIPLPPKQEQSAIASILSSQESIISKTKDLIANLDKRNQFMMDELLSGRLRVKEENGQPIFYKNADDNWQTVKINGEDVDIPKDWCVTNLEEEIDWFTTGNAFKTNEMKANGKYPVIKMTDIKNGKIEKDFKVFCDTFKEKALLQFGDLVVGLSGSVGKVGEVLTRKEVLLNQRCLGLRIKKFKIYIRNILEHNFKKWIDSTVKDGVIPNLSHLDVLKYNIPKLSEKEKQMIDNILYSLQLEKQKYEEILKKEEQTFTFLLEELMSGRLRIKI